MRDFSSKYYLILTFLLLSLALLLVGTSSTLAAIFFIFLGIAMMFFNWQILMEHGDIHRWEKVPIEITTIDIVEKIEPDRFLDKIYYYPVVTFSYDYGDRSYKNGSFALDIKSFMFSEIENAEAYLDKKLKDCSTAYCNSKKPDEAYIELSLTSTRKMHYFTMIIAGLVLFILGIGITFL